MGDFAMMAGVKKNATDSLNYLFDEDIAKTFKNVEAIRVVVPTFLNPMWAKKKTELRKETLRYAAFHLTDELRYSNKYPAKKFQKFLKWLTWLGQQNGGDLKLDGAVWVPPNDSTGTPIDYAPSNLLLYALQQALPPGGTAKPVKFLNFSEGQLAVYVDRTTTPWTIEVHSQKENDTMPDHGDDEDDVP
jgi:hypothetical protein